MADGATKVHIALGSVALDLGGGCFDGGLDELDGLAWCFFVFSIINTSSYNKSSLTFTSKDKMSGDRGNRANGDKVLCSSVRSLHHVY
jgi:hypothetical protein